MSILQGFQGPQGLTTDVTGTLRGVGQGLMGIRALGRDMEADQLAQRATSGDMDALAMLGRLDPQAAQHIGGIVESGNAQQAAQARAIVEGRARAMAGYLDAVNRGGDSAGMQWLTLEAQRRRDAGQPIDDLVEFASMPSDQRRMVADRDILEARTIDDILTQHFRGAVPDKEILDEENRLRTQYTQAISEIENSRRALNRFEANIATGANTSASDRALLASALRVFSPEARVTDRGVDAAGAPGNILELAGGLFEFLRGGGTLTTAQRQELANAVRTTARAEIGKNLQEVNQRFTSLAQGAGARPEQVVTMTAGVDDILSPEQPQQRQTRAPQAALDFLRENNTPENRRQFREKFGYLPEGF